MNTASKRTILIAAALLVLGGTAEAQISCGAVITTDKTMTADIDCPSHDPAFTVVGPAIVNMNGHVVLGCKPAGTGILVKGQGATVSHGAVRGCGTGIRVTGTGGHKLSNMVATDNEAHGFLIDSNNNVVEKSAAVGNLMVGFLAFSLTPLSGNSFVDDVADYNQADGFNLGGTKNKVNNCLATQNEGNGFRLVGTDNVLYGNIAAANDSDCFYVHGSDNRVYENVATECYQSGFAIASSDSTHNKLVKNIAAGNALLGFQIADGSLASDNTAVENEQDGMRLLGAGAQVIDNVSAGNYRHGIQVLGAGGLVKGNRSLGNDDLGIEIGAGPGTTIVGNSAIGNDLLDLLDNAVSCGGHDWSNNIFATAAPFCID